LGLHGYWLYFYACAQARLCGTNMHMAQRLNKHTIVYKKWCFVQRKALGKQTKNKYSALKIHHNTTNICNILFYSFGCFGVLNNNEKNQYLCRNPCHFSSFPSFVTILVIVTIKVGDYCFGICLNRYNKEIVKDMTYVWNDNTHAQPPTHLLGFNENRQAHSQELLVKNTVINSANIPAYSRYFFLRYNSTVMLIFLKR